MHEAEAESMATVYPAAHNLCAAAYSEHTDEFEKLSVVAQNAHTKMNKPRESNGDPANGGPAHGGPANGGPANGGPTWRPHMAAPSCRPRMAVCADAW